MKKRNITFAILLLAVLFTAVGVGKTYARYITKDTGTGEATVAKWHAVITEWNGKAATEKVLTLTTTKTENPYVVEGLIAPDVTAKGELNIDLTGTQVATDLLVELGDLEVENAPTDFDDSKLAEHFEATLDIYNEDGTTLLKSITTEGEKYLIELNGTTLKNEKVLVKVGLKWKHTETDASNAWDTSLGEYDSTAPVIKAELNVTAQQHILSDD